MHGHPIQDLRSLEHAFSGDISISGCRWKERGELLGLISSMGGFISARHGLREGLQKGQVIDLELRLLELFKLLVDKVLGDFGAYA
jgi:hypothetical protein